MALKLLSCRLSSYMVLPSQSCFVLVVARRALGIGCMSLVCARFHSTAHTYFCLTCVSACPACPNSTLSHHQGVWLDARQRDWQWPLGDVWCVCGPVDRVCHRRGLPQPDPPHAHIPGHCGPGVGSFGKKRFFCIGGQQHTVVDVCLQGEGRGGEGGRANQQLVMVGGDEGRGLGWVVGVCLSQHTVVGTLQPLPCRQPF